MVSDFRKKKLLHTFNVVFDANKSGSIDKADFDLTLEKIATRRGYKPGDVAYQIVSELLKGIWEGLKQEADKDGDGVISADEWVVLWDKYSQDPDTAPEWQKLFKKCVFTLLDASHDNSLDAEEFASVYESFGRDKQKSIEAFSKLAGGKATISEDEFETLWKEYFKSENPEDRGNFIFGYID